MRSPVLPMIKRKAPKLESLEAFMELLSRFELESTSRGAGSAGARSDLGLKCASRKGMRSPVLPTVKENLQNPKALKVSGAAIQIRTGVHVPRSRLRGSPERPRIEMRFAQGDEVSSLSCNKKKCSETRKFRSIYGAAIQIRTGVHVPRSRLRGSPERPRIRMRFAQGMRSPVYFAIKRNAPKLESLGAFMELLSRFELETSSLPRMRSTC